MQRATLRKLLSTLVDDSGYEAVRESLEELNTARAGASPSSKSAAKKKPRTKATATSIVEALALSDAETKEILLLLAQRYEEKSFMPNVNNVRGFLVKEGFSVSHIRSRQQGVSAVFKCLAKWNANELRELDDRGMYGQPKSLSMIAQSIESAAQ